MISSSTSKLSQLNFPAKLTVKLLDSKKII